MFVFRPCVEPSKAPRSTWTIKEGYNMLKIQRKLHKLMEWVQPINQHRIPIRILLVLV